jgi:lipoprotein-anchoring transpeptidase ErfK/SrfK
MSPSRVALALLLAALGGSSHSAFSAESVAIEPGDIPLPPGVRSVRPLRKETTVFAAPGARPARRGTLEPDAIVPLLGTSRASGCAGRWMQIGAEAWVCSDAAQLAYDEPLTVAAAPPENGLPFSYYFVGRQGAESYLNLSRAFEEAPETSEEAGFGLAIDELRNAHGDRWGHTSKGRWVRLADLTAAQPSRFEGVGVASTEELAALAWTIADKVPLFATDKLAGKPLRILNRHERLTVLEAAPGGKALKVRVESADGLDGAEGFLRPQGTVARPTIVAAPAELVGGERWVDVDLASQTLVAFEGNAPVFATLVSTGRGKEGSETATPKGTRRVWAKLRSTTMANVEDEDAAGHYSLEEVPWVLFFDKGVALHGAFWHRDFGRVRSHGCVNLAPRDAAWLFSWAGPPLPVGWSAVLPSPADPGTLVRVR